MIDIARPKDFLLSVVVPCFNEEAVIGTTYDRICKVLEHHEFRLEMVFVDDGSQDATGRILSRISVTDRRVKVVTLARNFGHQAAVSAGLAHAIGDAIAVMDADLQDPPDVLLKMVDKWREGFDVVYGIRTKRKEYALKRFCYAAFYRAFRWMAYIDTPLDAGDFSLIDKQVLSHINNLPEKNRVFRGLRAWVGFKQTGVSYERHARAAGYTKYPLYRLVKLASDGVFNFSTVPLTIVFVLGLAMSMIALSAIVFVVTLRIFDIAIFGQRLRDVQGFASTILTILLIGGIQLISTGILGEYIGRIYQEVKSRPSYIVQQLPAETRVPSGGQPPTMVRDTTERESAA